MSIAEDSSILGTNDMFGDLLPLLTWCAAGSLDFNLAIVCCSGIVRELGGRKP